MAIHSKAQLKGTEKLAYLRDALKDGPARHAIQRLIHDAACYKQAIDCLQKRYDQLCVIHRAHTRAILDTPVLKDGNGEDVQRLHDVTIQHLRALRMMKNEIFA